MSRRFYSSSPIEAPLALLSGQEARHLSQVMRAKTDEVVFLFDGSGAEFRGQIREVRRDEVEIEILERLEPQRETEWPLTLAVALPKGDRQKVLVEKCTELGVAELIPVQTLHGVAQPNPQAVRRLQRAVIEASKQCGRNRLMRVGEPQRFTQVVARTKPSLRLLADPAGDRWDVQLTGPALIAVGPEGGFADGELEQARQHGWQIRSLGPRILRVETAALAMAAALLLGD